MGIFDSMLVKYGAVMVGYTVVGLPVFGPNREQYLKDIQNDPTKITKDYVRNSSLLINLAKAIGRIVVSYKDIQNLSGYTTLIHELDEVLHDLKKGKFQRTQVTNDENQDQEGAATKGGSINTPKKIMNDMTGKGQLIIGQNIIF